MAPISSNIKIYVENIKHGCLCNLLRRLYETDCGSSYACVLNKEDYVGGWSEISTAYELVVCEQSMISSESIEKSTHGPHQSAQSEELANVGRVRIYHLQYETLLSSSIPG